MTKRLNKIRERLANGMTNDAIVKELKFSWQNYRKYLLEIYEQDREELLMQMGPGLEHEILLLKTRMLRTISNCEKIAESKRNASVRLEAERLKIDVAINILRLLVEGANLMKIGGSRTGEYTKYSKYIQKAVDSSSGSSQTT